jgi:hypothetical protein
MTVLVKILLHRGIITLLLSIFIGIFTLPSFLCAQESSQTYDRDTIRYPSMNTGQVWAKIGKSSFSNPGQVSQIMKNDSAQNGEARTSKKAQPKISNQENKKEIQKASTDRSLQKKKVHLAKKTSSETPKSDEYGKNRQSTKELHDSEMQTASPLKKNWHHKQELYDVDCAEKLARVVFTYYFDKQEKLLGSRQTNDSKWKHIYPGSFEEQLYTEICHPR